MPSGIKCKSPALRSTPFCYFHTHLYRTRNPSASDNKEPIFLPSLEDSTGVQIALQQILGALGSSRLDPRRAGLYLRGLQLAVRVAAPRKFDSSQESVRDLVYENNGDTLALEKTTCEPPQDCLGCKQRDQCEDFKNYEDEVEELEQYAEGHEKELDDKRLDDKAD
jgi:hypothetical protein